LDRQITAVNAIHINKVGYKFVVTAKAEQIPKICKAIGLSLKIGFRRISLLLDI
jgi:hypothetical protein